MRFPDLLTPAERRLAVLLFVLSAIGSAARVGERLSPEVRAWLWEDVPPAPVASAPDTLPPPFGPRLPPPPPPPGGAGGARLDVNRADRAALQSLPGVGPVLAERILEDRARNGPFRSVDELRRVKGIGEKTLERLRPLVAVP
jgi:competence ComEA-like helix-hairpin-helix protein